MESGMIDGIKERFGLTGDDPSQYSPLALAFIGDSIYGAVVKTAVVLAGNCSANRLDAKAVKSFDEKEIVLLTEQGLLREEELAIYKRGRNAKSQTVAKNAPVGDYRKATGLEALIGWLYLRGDMDRVLEIIKIAADVSGN